MANLPGSARLIFFGLKPKLIVFFIELDVVTVGKFYATFLIQNWFREWQKRRMIQKDTRYIPQIMVRIQLIEAQRSCNPLTFFSL